MRRRASLTSLAWLLAAGACATTPNESTVIGAEPAARPPARAVTMDDLWATPFGDDLKGMPDDLRALAGQHVVITGVLAPIEGTLAFLGASSANLGGDSHVVQLHLPIAAVELPIARVRAQGVFRVGAAWVDGYCTEVFGMNVEHLDVLETLVPAETVKRSLSR